VIVVSKRYGRRRVDGLFEYSDSIEELEMAAARDNRAFLKETVAMLSFVLGTVVTYGFVGHYAPEWPKAIRFISILAGACSSAFICTNIAVQLKAIIAAIFTLGALSGIVYVLWRLA
jgi:CHASE2 domain-containing sensor protein